jgi:hypothetical protein
LNVRGFEQAIGASPVVTEALRRAADDPHRDHPSLPRQDAGHGPSDA